MELLTDLLLIQFVHCIIYFIIMLMFLRILSLHDRFILTHVHDVGHVECINLSQPVIDNQHLLNKGFGTGLFNQFQHFITAFCNRITIKLKAILISIIEVLDHAHQIIVTVFAASDIIYRISGQHQHLSQSAQAVFFIIVLEEERSLHTQKVGIVFPLIQILLIQIQNRLNLLFRKSNGLAVLVQDFHVAQFFFNNTDNRAVCIHIVFCLWNHGSIGINRYIQVIHIQCDNNLLIFYCNCRSSF